MAAEEGMTFWATEDEQIQVAVGRFSMVFWVLKPRPCKTKRHIWSPFAQPWRDVGLEIFLCVSAVPDTGEDRVQPPAFRMVPDQASFVRAATTR